MRSSKDLLRNILIQLLKDSHKIIFFATIFVKELRIYSLIIPRCPVMSRTTAAVLTKQYLVQLYSGTKARSNIQLCARQDTSGGELSYPSEFHLHTYTQPCIYSGSGDSASHFSRGWYDRKTIQQLNRLNYT